MDKGEMGNHGVFWLEKFNLDGPNGSQCYWHDLRNGKAAVFKKTIYMRISCGLGSFPCVWKGRFCYDGRKTKLCSIYQCVGEKVFPTMNRLNTNNAIFQPNNAAIDTFKLTKDWFKTKNIEFLDWTTKSPDLNPIENLLKIFSR